MLNRLLQTGGMIMTFLTAEMPSYTYAVKGEKLLRSGGCECMIARKEKTSSESCGYLLKISGKCHDALKILDRYAVPYKVISDGGA